MRIGVRARRGLPRGPVPIRQCCRHRLGEEESPGRGTEQPQKGRKAQGVELIEVEGVNRRLGLLLM